MGRLGEALRVLLAVSEAGSTSVRVTVSGNVRRAAAVVEAQSIRLRRNTSGDFEGEAPVVLTPTTIDIRIIVKGVPGLKVESSIEINGKKKTQSDTLTAEIETFPHTYPFSDFFPA